MLMTVDAIAPLIILQPIAANIAAVKFYGIFEIRPMSLKN
jgi:hypothetical protein